MLAYLRSRSICLCTKDIIGSSSSAVKSTCCEGKVATPRNAKSLVTVYALPCQLGRAVRRARERYGSLTMLLLLLISGFSVKTLSRSLVQKLSSRACLCWSLLILRGQYSTWTETSALCFYQNYLLQDKERIEKSMFNKLYSIQKNLRSGHCWRITCWYEKIFAFKRTFGRFVEEAPQQIFPC